MPDPLWPISTPEANHIRLISGTGPATTLANMAAWLTQLTTHELSFGTSTMNVASTGASFIGLGGTASAAASTELNGALQLLAGWVVEKPPLAEAAVTAYESACSTMIPAPVCEANRMEEYADNMINPAVWGALTPRIADLNLEYFGEHWPHNASAGAAYGAVLAGLTALLAVPAPVAPMMTPATAAAGSAASIAQATAQATGTQAMQAGSKAAETAGQGASSAGGDASSQMSSMVGQMGQLMQPMTQLFQMPMQMGQQVMQAAPQALQQLTGMFGQGMKGTDIASEAANFKATPGAGGVGISPASLGGGGGAGGLGGMGGGASPGMTSYTRPTSSFGEGPGRATSLRTGLLETAEMRAPTTGSGMSGGGMPMSPASMLNRGGEGSQKADEVARARVVVDRDRDSHRDV
ncbi:PPE family protein [soil metagenome]